MDIGYVERNKITLRKLTQSIPVNNMDSSSNTNGPVTEVADVVLNYNGHTERMVFALMQLEKEDLILELPWLKQHNPKVNWVMGEVKMSHCPQRCK